MRLKNLNEKVEMQKSALSKVKSWRLSSVRLGWRAVMVTGSAWLNAN